VRAKYIYQKVMKNKTNTTNNNFIKYLAMHRYSGIIVIMVMFVAVSTLSRTLLLIRSFEQISCTFTNISSIYIFGLIYDLTTAIYIVTPLVLYLTFLKELHFRKRTNQLFLRILIFIVIVALLFFIISEWLFWDEFNTRFNFIAIDYIIYIKEVVGNICESYNLPILLTTLFGLSAIIYWIQHRIGWMEHWFQSITSNKEQKIWALIFFSASSLSFLIINNQCLSKNDNKYNRELAKNGLYCLGAAAHNNEAEYKQSYISENCPKAFSDLKTILDPTGKSFINSNEYNNITHKTKNLGNELHYNIIQLTMESLSANYLTAFGNTERLTPNLDKIISNSLLFTNFYATGTRTVRAIESLTTSRPPSQGRSIVKRKYNNNLHTIADIFQQHGYTSTFIYSGDSKFDNMKKYFSGNNYNIFDITNVSEHEISFENCWGVCDEDLYNWVLKLADKSYESQQPFYYFVLNTTNHRPYTFPQEKINYPNPISPKGGVKYSDYAIGKFFEKAKTKPWYNKTIFVIVADHCHRTSGNMDLEPHNYNIPLIIFCPALISPQKNSTIASQIDFAPTLLGILNWSYQSNFYGQDILKTKPKNARALIANYESLGYMTANSLTILKPKFTIQNYTIHNNKLIPTKTNQKLAHKTIAYYQTAAHLFLEQQKKQIKEEKQKHKFLNFVSSKKSH